MSRRFDKMSCLPHGSILLYELYNINAIGHVEQELRPVCYSFFRVQIFVPKCWSTNVSRLCKNLTITCCLLLSRRYIKYFNWTTSTTADSATMIFLHNLHLGTHFSIGTLHSYLVTINRHLFNLIYNSTSTTLFELPSAMTRSTQVTRLHRKSSDFM